MCYELCGFKFQITQIQKIFELTLYQTQFYFPRSPELYLGHYYSQSLWDQLLRSLLIIHSLPIEYFLTAYPVSCQSLFLYFSDTFHSNLLFITIAISCITNLSFTVLHSSVPLSIDVLFMLLFTCNQSWPQNEWKVPEIKTFTVLNCMLCCVTCRKLVPSRNKNSFVYYTPCSRHSG